MKLIDKGPERKEWEPHNSIPINVGAEGDKVQGGLKAKERIVDGLFFKMVESREEAEKQKKKWESLKERGINVSPTFRIAQDKEGNVWIITTDLTQKDKKWVVSTNNNERWTNAEYWQQLVNMSQEKRNDLIKSILDIAIKAGTKDEQGESIAFFLDEGKTFSYSAVVDKTDPNSVEIVIVDLGIDVRPTNEDEDEVIKINIREAILFLSETLGIFTEIPKDHPAYKYKDVYSDNEWKGMLAQKVIFDMTLKMMGVELPA